jgi:hypothetical protein
MPQKTVSVLFLLVALAYGVELDEHLLNRQQSNAVVVQQRMSTVMTSKNTPRGGKRVLQKILNKYKDFTVREVLSDLAKRPDDTLSSVLVAAGLNEPQADLNGPKKEVKKQKRKLLAAITSEVNLKQEMSVRQSAKTAIGDLSMRAMLQSKNGPRHGGRGTRQLRRFSEENGNKSIQTILDSAKLCQDVKFIKVLQILGFIKKENASPTTLPPPECKRQRSLIQGARRLWTGIKKGVKKIFKWKKSKKIFRRKKSRKRRGKRRL